jgi:hypothetical protein
MNIDYSLPFSNSKLHCVNVKLMVYAYELPTLFYSISFSNLQV